jgi:ketosteroid isomerase-like protein
MRVQVDGALAVLETYRAAVAARDVDGLVGLYAEDVHRFDTWEEADQVGVAAWREAVAQWLGAHADDVYEVQFDEGDAVAGDSVAFVRAVMTFRVLTDGVVTHEQVHRFTAGLAMQDGAWRIAHEHTSMPVAYAATMAEFRGG